jgi:hypothetical protein
MKEVSPKKYWSIVAAVIGMYQIIYGVMFLFAAIFNMDDAIDEKTKSFLVTSQGLQAKALFVFSALTLFSGIMIFMNWQVGRKMAAVLCLFNAAADFFIGCRYNTFEDYKSIANFYFIFAVISLLFGVLLHTRYLKTVATVG